MSPSRAPRRSADEHISRVRQLLEEGSAVHNTLARGPVEVIVRVANAMADALRSGRKIIWFGNGGSATQSQHMAAEFVGRFCHDRRALPSLSLTENMASVTAIANDYDYERIFSRQLEALSQPGDVAVGLSTSGSSRNVLAGLRRAKELGVTTVALTRDGQTPMKSLANFCICVPSTVTARIQEAHLTIGHILCELVEERVIGGKATPARRASSRPTA